MRDKPPSTAKITRPVLPEVLQRNRLFRLLDKGRKRPVLWISGPAGSGKTTLVGSYIDARKLPCLWYRLDEGDGDIATFFYYLGLAARKVSPKRKPLGLLTPEYLAGIPTFTRRFFEDLCGRLKPPYAIVLDNYQDVPLASPFHEMIVHGLNAIPAGVTVVVMSRREPPATFSRMRANEKVSFVPGNEVRLTAEESREIVALRDSDGVFMDKAPLLHERTAGWVAGMVLLIESLKSSASGQRLSKKVTLQEIFDYFASEIFGKLDIESQRFLLKTAFLPKIAPELAEQLTGNPRSGGILEHLYRDNYFTERHHHSTPVYFYHPLFREFLLSRARGVFSAHEIKDMQIFAAQAMIAQGDHVEDAALLFIEAGEMEGLIGLILREAQGLAAQGRSRTLEEWIDKTPPEARDVAPWLHFWKGVCRQPAGFTESRAHFERALNRFDAQDDKVGMLLSWSSVVEMYWFGGGDLALLDDWIDWLEKRIGNGASFFPSPEIEAQVMTSLAGAVGFARSEHPQLRKWLERALHLAESSSNIAIRFKVYGAAILYWAWRGDNARCMEYVSAAEALAIATELPPMLQIVSKSVAAMACLSSFEHNEKALRCVTEGLEISGRTGVRVFDPVLYIWGVYLMLSLGRMKEAKGYLENVRRTLGADRVTDNAHYHFLTAWYHLLVNDLGRARTHADMSLDFLARSSGNPTQYALTWQVAALVRQQMGDHREAGELFGPVRDYGQKTTSPYFRQLILLTEAEFAFDKGDELGGIEALRAAMTLGRQHDFTATVYLWRTPVLARLCTRALDAGIETDYVKRYIKKCNLPPGPEMIHREDWPRPVKVYTLGRFGIVRDEEPLTFSGKVQQRPLTMLKAVIAFGGRDVPEDQLIEALWPEADGDTAHMSVATTLHRLRRLLGSDDALQLSEGRISLDQRHCWVDAWGFQRIAGEAVNLWKKEHGDESAKVAGDGRIREAIALSESAVGLYKGDFLSGDSRYPWALPMRERLKGKFVRLISRLGEHYERSRQWNKAIECCHRGLDTDDLQEEFYRRLMWCCHSAGRRAEALAAYKRCREVLSSSFGIEPSRRTVETARVIREHKSS